MPECATSERYVRRDRQQCNRPYAVGTWHSTITVPVCLAHILYNRNAHTAFTTVEAHNNANSVSSRRAAAYTLKNAELIAATVYSVSIV
eukprot:19166-Heterococcus_DN1.PRE.2